ncbi:Rpn family recombination-promoting nuclease/putative transposase [Fluviispira vulneris]|uniref:Rpn family recombination-promoting nuclease/putative transposase n=1 Tax=Fluviispira vulneris TaxID=2763012 RepID=UPI0016471881|nr:Rpn family recombination-promoting nuclease/putative transposase [Fluviispira vulneris]
MKKLDLLDIKTDYVFKKVFTHNQKTFIDFINCVLNYPEKQKIKSIEFLNNELTKDSEMDKESKLDIIARLNDNSYVNVEMQIQNTGEYEKRSLYYWAKLYETQLQKTQNYKVLYPAICINILNFNFFKNSADYNSELAIFKVQTMERIYSDFKIIFLEIPKVKKKFYNDLDKWMQFFNGASKEEINTMNNSAIKQAYETLEYISQDPAERARYEARRKYQLDYNTGMLTAREEGKEEGKEEGIEIEKRANIKQMLKLNLPIEQIAEISRLSVEEVCALKS